MATNIVTISGMFGNDKTYFSDSPVVIDITGLDWPRKDGKPTSPFNIVRVEVVYNGSIAGKVHEDTGGQSSASFDISSALRAIWSGYDMQDEVAAAQQATEVNAGQTAQRAMRPYFLRVSTEYISSDGKFTTTQCTDDQGNTDIPGGRCIIGGLTEWERSLIADKADADVSHLEHTGLRNGDASTKPTESPERVGRDSITSWVDVQQGYTRSTFYPPSAPQEQDAPSPHAPRVLRDNRAYTDFLFVNRRGALESCSAVMMESMGIDVEAKQYVHETRPSFNPSYTLTSMGQGGRRSWQMSSGYQTREWAEWWVMEFLAPRKNRKHWMLYNGRYVPVIVEPAKKQSVIYDLSKQNMASVEFTVTLSLEG